MSMVVSTIDVRSAERGLVRDQSMRYTKAHLSAAGCVSQLYHPLLYAGWVSEPANTWSNLTFIVVSALIWMNLHLTIQADQSARPKQAHIHRLVRAFAPIVFFMGLFSLVYHASVTFLLQAFDFFGMFLYTVHMITLNLIRARVITVHAYDKAFWSGVYVASFASVHICYVQLT